jgi:MFS family permease
MTLCLIGLLYLVSFVDRFILALLVQPLKQDLGISEVQLGLLFGTAFALFYALLGLPFARLADRYDRRRLIFAGAVLWSLSTIASGFANSYGWLVLLRVGLAIGEAALTPAAFSLIGDLFPPHQRRRAASFYSAFGMVGAGGGYMIGGFVIAVLAGHLGNSMPVDFSLWQLVLIAVGVPSLVLTLLFAILVREPRRAERPAPQDLSPLREILRYGRRRLPLFASLIVGAGLCQIPAYAMVAWMPYVLQTEFGIPTARVGMVFGAVAVAATVGGTLLLPYLVDRLQGRLGAAIVSRLSAASALLAVAAIATASAVSTLPVFLGLTGLGLMLLTGAANNILVAFQTLVPAHMRATFTALCLLSITLLGLGVGPLAFAAIRALAPGA